MPNVRSTILLPRWEYAIGKMEPSMVGMSGLEERVRSQVYEPKNQTMREVMWSLRGTEAKLGHENVGGKLQSGNQEGNHK